jgi:protein required for attachment to host cells
MVIDWILIADRSRACVRAVLPIGDESFPVLKTLEHAEGRFTPHERDTDKPGRIQLRGVARSAVEPHEDAAHVEARRFAAEIAEFLEREHQDLHFDRLHVIAPPAFLGVLRAAWSEKFRRAIAQEIDSDLLTLSEPDLKDRLTEILAASAAT